MKKTENECRGCAVPGHPCIGSACPYSSVTRYYCDKCGEEISADERYTLSGVDDLCEECLLKLCRKEADEE